MTKVHRKTNSMCCICCEEVKGDGILLHKTRRQTHKTCLECGIAYLTPKVNKILDMLCQNIRSPSMLEVPCPGSVCSQLRNHCTVKVDLHNLLVEDVIPHMTKIHFVLMDKYLYICPNRDCMALVRVHPEDPILHTECSQCKYNWCRGCWKSPFHEGVGCLEHEVNEASSQNGRFILEKIECGDMKYCPKCRSPTEKTRGEDGKFVACNKMSCVICNTKWCWLCQKSDIDYSHFSDKNSGCQNMLWKGSVNET